MLRHTLRSGVLYAQVTRGSKTTAAWFGAAYAATWAADGEDSAARRAPKKLCWAAPPSMQLYSSLADAALSRRSDGDTELAFWATRLHRLDVRNAHKPRGRISSPAALHVDEAALPPLVVHLAHQCDHVALDELQLLRIIGHVVVEGTCKTTRSQLARTADQSPFQRAAAWLSYSLMCVRARVHRINPPQTVKTNWVDQDY